MALQVDSFVTPTQRMVIQEIANSLSCGESDRSHECPVCKAEEQAFVVTRRETFALYVCHRAKCGVQGRVTCRHSGSSEGSYYKRATGSSKMASAINKLVPLPTTIKDYLFSKYRVSVSSINKYGILWSPETQRVFFSIRNQYGNEVGGVMRSLSASVKPKSLTVLTTTEALPMAFYSSHGVKGGGVQLVVEDQLSAMRAASYVPSVALLGTNLNHEGVRAIRRLSRNIVICLDADAFTKGIELQKRWRDSFDSCILVKPPKDLKDMSEDDLEDFITTKVLPPSGVNAA